MRTLVAIGLVGLVGCSKSGEHQSVAYVSDDGSVKLEPAAVDTIQVELTKKITNAGLSPCTWAKPRKLQLGAHPVAWFCGRLGSTAVEASINRPGMNNAAIELDLRADVSGTSDTITKLEKPVIALRNDVVFWFRQNVERWWSTPANTARSPMGRNGCCPATGTFGDVLGDDLGLP